MAKNLMIYDVQPTLEWVKSAEQPGGGLAAWRDPDHGWHKSYPEVSGYMIPTLLAYGEEKLATRLGKWLITQQQPSGAWLGIDGKVHTFDTAAVLEGLKALSYQDGVEGLDDPMERGYQWLVQQHEADAMQRVYEARTYGIMELGAEQGELTLWHWDQERSHYLAYMLEGMLLQGDHIMQPLLASYQAAKDCNIYGLYPFMMDGDWQPQGGTDIPATAQFANLLAMHTDPAMVTAAKELLDNVSARITSTGGVPQGIGDNREVAWGAKYYLDAVKRYSEAMR